MQSTHPPRPARTAPSAHSRHIPSLFPSVSAWWPGLIALALAVLVGSLPSAAPRPATSQPAAGTIHGRTLMTSGAPLPGVHVAVRCGGAGGTRSTVSDSTGRFRIDGLAPGDCSVLAVFPGFRTLTTPLRLSPGETRIFDLTMKTDTADEARSVPTATAPALAAPSVFTVGATKSSQAPLGVRPPRPWSGRPVIPNRPTSFDRYDERPFLTVAANPLSTFSIDVDTASYAYVRRSLTQGTLPPKDAVRIEEMLNYFRYDYPEPPNGKPVGITTETGPCPWNPANSLLLVGIQGRSVREGPPPARNLIFLLDVSGSMQPRDKLPLVKAAMSLLALELTARDRVGIVVYAGDSGVALPPTPGDQREVILSAIDRLHAGGSTNGAAGIELAYDMAARHFDREGVNRVILATDGDFNVGVTSRGDLLDLIEAKRKSGIFLSVLGVGDDNLQDGTMEQLADRGNGNYAYLDSLEEAQRVLVRESNATLVTVAKDVKIQVEFNPASIAAYRLVGYENRALQAEDFRDDLKDAGELGAGHSVTALYELVPPGEGPEIRPVDPLRYQKEGRSAAATRRGELVTVKVRYKEPAGTTSIPIDAIVRDTPAGSRRSMSAHLGFSAAVAAFGMLLRDSEHKGLASWRMVSDLASAHQGSDREGYRAEFVRLAGLAEALTRSARPVASGRIR